MEGLNYVLLTTMLTFAKNTASQSSELDFCSYQSSTMISSVTLVANQDSAWSADDACRCVVSPNFNSSEGTYRLMNMEMSFRYNAQTDEVIPPCLPIIQVDPLRKLEADSSYPLGIRYDVCPGIGDTKRHVATQQIYKGQQFAFHIYNPGRAPIYAQISVHEFSGLISVQCEPYERIMYEEEICPCKSFNNYEWNAGMSSASQFDEVRRLTIGLVTALIFVLIIVAIIVGFVFYKKRQAKKEAYKAEAVTVENKAYEGSKQSVATEEKKQVPKTDAAISYTPDPTLNLKLQQPAYHGSHDSGLASSNDNNDREKRLPFMQPPPNSRSLDDITQMPPNYPALAGQGSQSSLNTSIDPVYTTRPAKPAQNTDLRFKEPANNPPLAGHGSQSSLDNPRHYPEDVDVTYAKPMKRKLQQDTLSHLYDKINVNAPSPVKEDQFHSAESLNASSATVHTDV